jgi:hypothetical protein
MPDIATKVITPEELSGQGEAGPFDIERFSKKCLAQGDSWFSIGGLPPWATTNLLFQMVFSQSACIVNCALPGKQLAHMFDTSSQRRFLRLLRGRLAFEWDAILISGGGNDLIDAASSPPSATLQTRLLLKSDEWDANLPAATRYLSTPGWNTFTTHMAAVFERLLTESSKGPNQATPIVFHSYDVAVPRDAGAGLGAGPWLHKAFESFGVPAVDRTDAAVELLTRLRDFLARMVTDHPGAGLTLVDTLGTVARASAQSGGASGDWENEIHPTPHGYSLLAQRWRPVVEQVW